MLQLFHYVCGKDQAVVDYFLNWLSHIFQKPYEKPGTCIIIQGDQGVGKDTLVDFVGRMLGLTYYKPTSRPEHDVFGKFNGTNKKAIFIKFEEANFLTNKNGADRLKALITSPTEVFENKGEPIVTLDSFCRIIMTTNAEVPCHIEDSDRRFIMWKASSDKIKDREYWDSVYQTLQKPETLKAFYHLLLTRDISNFDPKNRPITEFYQEVKEVSIPPHAKFLQALFEKDHEMLTHNYFARDLLRDMNASFTKFEYNETKFGREMRKYPGIIKTHTKRGTKYEIDVAVVTSHLKAKGWWYDF